MRKINEIIIHHSDSDVKAHDDIRIIRKWHTEERGWRDVGYHYFIRKDGVIQRGRPLDVAGAHCVGHNRASIGICLSGEDNFTDVQFCSLHGLLKDLYGEFGRVLTVGHCAYSEKKCPNFDVDEFLRRFRLI
jgi:N-acetyl-anhydromuramyl-L-alanine amidase AmpD